MAVAEKRNGTSSSAPSSAMTDTTTALKLHLQSLVRNSTFGHPQSMCPVANSTPITGHVSAAHPLPSSASLYNFGAQQPPASTRVQKSQSMGSFRQVVPQNGVHTENGAYARTSSMDEMVQDVVYALGGYESNFFKKDVPGGGLKVNTKTGVNAKDYAMLSRLCETAYYLERIIAFTDSSTGQSPLGLLGQGLVTALKQELTQYYGFVAMLQERVRIFLDFFIRCCCCCCYFSSSSSSCCCCCYHCCHFSWFLIFISAPPPCRSTKAREPTTKRAASPYYKSKRS